MGSNGGAWIRFDWGISYIPDSLTLAKMERALPSAVAFYGGTPRMGTMLAIYRLGDLETSRMVQALAINRETPRSPRTIINA